MVADRLHFELKHRQEKTDMINGPLRKIGIVPQLLIFTGFLVTYFKDSVVPFPLWCAFVLWTLLVIIKVWGFMHNRMDRCVLLLEQAILLKKNLGEEGAQDILIGGLCDRSYLDDKVSSVFKNSGAKIIKVPMLFVKKQLDKISKKLFSRK